MLMGSHIEPGYNTSLKLISHVLCGTVAHDSVRFIVRSDFLAAMSLRALHSRDFKFSSFDDQSIIYHSSCFLWTLSASSDDSRQMQTVPAELTQVIDELNTTNLAQLHTIKRLEAALQVHPGWTSV